MICFFFAKERDFFFAMNKDSVDTILPTNVPAMGKYQALSVKLQLNNLTNLRKVGRVVEPFGGM